MRLIALVSLAFFVNEASAESVFGVTTEDIVICNTLSEINRVIAEGRDNNETRAQLATRLGDDVSDAVREDLLDIVFSSTPGDPGYVKKVTGALCILERLQPREVK